MSDFDKSEVYKRCNLKGGKGMKEINSNYEINSETLAIISLDNGTSKIIEKDYTVEISCNHLKIIDNSCKYFGSSYTGRFEGTKKIGRAHV